MDSACKCWKAAALACGFGTAAALFSGELGAFFGTWALLYGFLALWRVRVAGDGGAPVDVSTDVIQAPPQPRVHFLQKIVCTSPSPESLEEPLPNALLAHFSRRSWIEINACVEGVSEVPREGFAQKPQRKINWSSYRYG